MRLLLALALAAIGLVAPKPAAHSCDGTTRGIAICANQRAAATEAQIHVVAAQIAVRMRATDRSLRRYPSSYFHGSAAARFARAERAWRAYRDATCASSADAAAGGSLSLDLAPLCRADLDRRHLADLRAFLHDLGPR